MKKIMLAVSLLLVLGSYSHANNMTAEKQMNIENGKYLITIAGCNDCHTDGYGEKGGQVPVDEWLKGSPLGWRGPWGTTYAANLGKFMQALTADQWIAVARKLETKPPMPWFNVNRINENDLRAIYRFVKSMVPGDMEVPDYLPPGEEPPQPYVQFPMPNKENEAA